MPFSGESQDSLFRLSPPAEHLPKRNGGWCRHQPPLSQLRATPAGAASRWAGGSNRAEALLSPVFRSGFPAGADFPLPGPVGAEAPAVPSGSGTSARKPRAPFPVSGSTWLGHAFSEGPAVRVKPKLPSRYRPGGSEAETSSLRVGLFREQAPWTSLRLRTGEPAGSVRRASGRRSLLPFAFRGPLRSRGSSSFLTISRPPKLLRSRSACRAGTLRPRPSSLPLPSGQAPRSAVGPSKPKLLRPSVSFPTCVGLDPVSASFREQAPFRTPVPRTSQEAIPRPRVWLRQTLARKLEPARIWFDVVPASASRPLHVRLRSGPCLRSVSAPFPSLRPVRLQLEGVTDRESHQANSACG